MPRFPRSIIAFQDRFTNDEACWEYLVKARWNGNVSCPTCGEAGKYFVETRAIWQCVNKHQWSATVGTIMHRSHLGLRKWFWAAWLMTTQTPGVSAMVLSRQIDVPYETAYMVLQRLRAATVDPLREQLRSKVEVDETYISAGRPRRTRRRIGRGTGKPMIVAAVETMRGGRVRFRRVSSGSAKNLRGFVRDHVREGAVVLTDGWQGYASLHKDRFKHRVVKAETEAEKAKKLPNVHQVFAELQAWLVGTHHGVSAKHLQAYMNEYAFRRDARANPQASFLKILRVGTHRGGPQYEEIYSVGEPGGWKHPNPAKRRRRRKH